MRYHYLLIIPCFLLFSSRGNSQAVTAKDSIQETAHFRKESSDKKPELWVSMGAAFISIIALILSVRQFRKTENREKREELRSIVEKLIDIRADYNNKLSDIAASEGTAFGDYYGKMFMVYLQAGDQLLESLDKKTVSPVQYFIIGSEFENEGDFFRAKKYYENAQRVSTKTSVKNQETTLRALAAFTI